MSRKRNRAKYKGRGESGSFLALPRRVLRSPNYVALSMHARALLVDVAVQYYGNNNGDLSPSWTLMHKRGWKSRETLYRALKELRHYGFLDLTRQGGLQHKASLYALTWLAVDDCGGKLDAGCGPTRVASGRWNDLVQPFQVAGKHAPNGSHERPAHQQQADQFGRANDVLVARSQETSQ